MLKLQNLSKQYGKKVVLDKLSYDFDLERCIYMITGKSGAGKSTLLNILFGIDQEYDGTYSLNGKNTKDYTDHDWDSIRSDYMQIVYQDFKLLEDFTVYDNLFISYCNRMKESKKEIREKVINIMKSLDIIDISSIKVKDISGGQKQRLAIARSLLNHPAYILLDEPTGNLDEENTKLCMEIIRKLTGMHHTTFIIITHDDRILPYADICLELREGLLSETNIKAITKNKHSIDLQKKVNRKFPTFSYLKQTAKSNISNLCIMHIPVIIILCTFIFVFGMITSSFKGQMNLFFKGFSDNAIYIATTNLTDEYQVSKKGIQVSDDGKRLGFSKQDLESVKAIKNIKDARLFNASNVSLYDKDINRLLYNLKKENFPSIAKNSASYSFAPEKIVFEFNSLTIPSEFFHDYNINRLELLIGNAPKENTNEILLPDILGYTINDDLNKVLGKEITFNTLNQNNEKHNQKYIVKGVYKTDFANGINENMAIYVPYMNDNFKNVYLQKDSYLERKDMDYTNNLQVEDYRNPIYDTYDTYKKAIGTGFYDMIIVLNDYKDMKEVTSELRSLFPNLQIMSRYELKEGTFSETYKRISLYIMLGLFALAIIMGLVIVFLNKAHIKNRSKELSICYSLGYSRKNITTLIVLEYLAMFLFDLIIAYALLFLSYEVYFIRTDYMKIFKDYIFHMNMMIQVVGFVIFIILISVIFSLLGIKKSKLKQYLYMNR